MFTSLDRVLYMFLWCSPISG